MPTIFLVQKSPGDGPALADLVLCSSARVARHEAGDTSKRADVWQLLGKSAKNRAFLLIRWKGLDVDYAATAKPSQLPDGTWTGLHYPGSTDAPWGLLKRAVWWSSRDLPAYFARKGVRAISSLAKDEAPTALVKLLAEAEALTADKAQYGSRTFGYRKLPALTLEVVRPGQPMLFPGFGGDHPAPPDRADAVPGTDAPAKEKKPRKPRAKKAAPETGPVPEPVPATA